MPSAPRELRERWKDDRTATDFLKSRGYRLTARYEWVPPDLHTPTEDELSAIDYMFAEWDYGGLAK